MLNKTFCLVCLSILLFKLIVIINWICSIIKSIKVLNFWCCMFFLFFYLSFKSTNKTGVLDNFFFIIFFSSEISKCVNDDTKDKVEDNNDDNKEEEHVIDESEGVERFRARWRAKHISNPTPIPETLVEGGDDAHPEGVTGPLLDGLLVKSSITFIIS